MDNSLFVDSATASKKLGDVVLIWRDGADFACRWEDRDEFVHCDFDDAPTESGGCVRVARTLIVGPEKFAAEIPTLVHSDGYVEERRVEWFDTHAEAQGAIDRAPPPEIFYVEEDEVAA